LCPSFWRGHNRSAPAASRDRRTRDHAPPGRG
jgi:hypothetical protein